MLTEQATRTSEEEVEDAIAHLCILRALRTENYEWYKELCTHIDAHIDVRASNYFFSWTNDDDSMVIGLCVVDDPSVRSVARLFMIDDAVFFGYNGDPIKLHTIEEFYAILQTCDIKKLRWFSPKS